MYLVTYSQFLNVQERGHQDEFRGEISLHTVQEASNVKTTIQIYLLLIKSSNHGYQYIGVDSDGLPKQLNWKHFK